MPGIVVVMSAALTLLVTGAAAVSPRVAFSPVTAGLGNPHAGAIAGTATEDARCGLQAPSSDTMQVRDCVGCHASMDHTQSHPVDVDYAIASSRHGSGLRSTEEVIRRGILLPDGKVACTSCHERRSPWKYHLAIPPGSKVEPVVEPGNPSTYAPRPVAPMLLPPGTDVGRKPMCMACHGFD